MAYIVGRSTSILVCIFEGTGQNALCLEEKVVTASTKDRAQPEFKAAQ